MKRIYVESSNLRSVGYDSTTKILEVEFNSGGIYQYFNVSEIVFQALLAADSKGQYFHRNIKNIYAYKRVG
ncbi:MAG: KTSC domain-containing protein [Firmicutes bacterium]|nr:KTSC domain-containing protein [Bacillota bacterium]